MAPAVKVGPGTPGAIVPRADFKTLSERGHTDRGVRRYYGYSFTPDGTLQSGQPAGVFAAIAGNPAKGPINYYDGGDYRGQNPSFSPKAEPLAGGPPYYNHNGRLQYDTQNWPKGSDVCSWNWGDQYVGGFLGDSGLCVIASLGCGRLFYQSSSGHTEEHIAELHVFDPDQLAEVSAGTRAKTAVQPAAIIPLKETATNYNSLYYHKYAAGFDPVAKRLYVFANQGDVSPYARPFKIYVYQINEREPEPEPIDPRDQQIAELTARVAELEQQAAGLTVERDALAAELTQLRQRVAELAPQAELLARIRSLLTEIAE